MRKRLFFVLLCLCSPQNEGKRFDAEQFCQHSIGCSKNVSFATLFRTSNRLSFAGKRILTAALYENYFLRSFLIDQSFVFF